ncbi:MAG: leucine--tRNA ligase [SAR202 cluster bacterium]|nr:leucine--tRNA ligase [SAR202 cluster bacterium]|tara:strand:+ start:9954 stop:12431 length:2478 start_codon:yes stop_codon:yes gene_type:complete
MTRLNSFSESYIPNDLEGKWQKKWSDDQVYKVDDYSDSDRKKWYELTMFPYTSGDIHIGHWYAMAPSDAHARFMNMIGFNVLHPMGFDAFGLPAENAAIKGGKHPKTYTESNLMNMRRQLKSMGNMYDWSRELVTCSPEYYKWNQWLFLKLYEAGLAYRDFAPVNWCPSCNTSLANEQVLDENLCERCDTKISRKNVNQWLFRITKYAEELLDFSKLQWPEKINIMQSNWIGRSSGVEFNFDISEYNLHQKTLTTFTTRIDTVFGVTFIVMAPEHDLVKSLTTDENLEKVENYIENSRNQSELERLSTEKEKTGVFTGSYCINNFTGEKVPIFIGDYVLASYGTGVVMGVPAHDQRDFDFAQKYNLDIRVVIAPDDWEGENFTEAFVGNGKQVNSGRFDGLENVDALNEIANFVEQQGFGNKAIQYRIRDWLISRQRYWGTPIPIIHCEKCGIVPVPEKDLPVILPDDAEFRPTGESPLKLKETFVNVDCPNCGEAAIRETDTMDTFVDSSWYQFRFISPNFIDGPFDKNLIDMWGPVDQYTGGAEHAVMHLLYARFFTKALRDLGILNFDEPFIRLFNQGHIISGAQKMSKSRGNVVAPDEFVERYGADTVRCYLMFIGPWSQGGEWSDDGIKGMWRWMNRVWDLTNRDFSELENVNVSEEDDRELKRLTHKTIKSVYEDLKKFKFNTSLALLMQFTNDLNSMWEMKNINMDTWSQAIESLVLMLSPMAPHITEEIWEKLGNKFSIHSQKFPDWDDKLLISDSMTLVIQVNGRVRETTEVTSGIDESEIERLALDLPNVKKHIDGKNVIKTIYIKGKLINIVVQ